MPPMEALLADNGKTARLLVGAMELVWAEADRAARTNNSASLMLTGYH